MANQIWVEVYNPAGTTMLGIVMCVSASVTRPLDSAGAVNITFPTTDANAINLLQVWRLVKIYWNDPIGGKTLIGGGFLLSESINITSVQTTWAGQNLLNELRRINTWRGLEYDDDTVFNVITDLVGHVPGWSAIIDSGLGNTSRRFDGQSILRALLMVVSGKGIHMRLSQETVELSYVVEVGAFGDDSGLRMTNLPTASREAQQNPDLVILSSLSVIEDGFEIKNRVEPVWGGGDAVLTLRRSTRTSPYTILEMPGPDGRTIYYLEDTASIAQYGVVEGVLSMTDAPYIAPDGGASVINASDVLYDWAANQLMRIAQPKKTYQATGLKLDRKLNPGDKIRLTYKGYVMRQGIKYTWLDVDELFWVLSVTEAYDMRGQTVNIQISNIDEQTVNASNLIADSLILQETAAILQVLTSSQSIHSEELNITPGTPGVLAFDVSTLTVAIGNTNLLMTRPNPSRPDTISVAIDGTDRTSELGGPWFVGALDNDPVSLAIEEYLDTGDIRGEHTITVSALLRSGVIETTVEIVEIGVSG